MPRKRKLELVPIANLKFIKHEHGKLKKHRTPVISPGHGVRRVHVNNVNSRNTEVYIIYTEVMEFQVKAGRVLGLSHILQQHTTKNIQKAVILDHSYSKPLPAENPKPSTSDELISPIKEHPVSLPEIQHCCKSIKGKLQLTEEEIHKVELETRGQSSCNEWFHHRKYRITASKAY